MMADCLVLYSVIPDVSNKDLVRLLIYVLHRGSIDCVANHMFGFSRFYLNDSSPWVARITVTSWMLQDLEPHDRGANDTGSLPPAKQPEVPQGEEGYRRRKEKPIYIPANSKREKALHHLKGIKGGQHKVKRKQVALTVSSIAISTTAFGDFSKTTIISEILPGSKIIRAGEEAQKLWRVFIHQPQTARCLAFLLLLGLLCQEIAQQYNQAADYFADILNLDVSLPLMTWRCPPSIADRDRQSNRDATHYIECHDSVETLGLVLWCLESLYKLHHSLGETIKAIQQAREELVAQITEVRPPEHTHRETPLLTNPNPY